MTAGVLRETAPGERRVALVPELVRTVGALGLTVLVEPGAGTRAWCPDDAYTAVGARLVPRTDLLRRADILLGVQSPNLGLTHRFRPGQLLIALLRPTLIPFLVRQWADQGLTAIGLDLVPEKMSDGYPMDARTSQARIAGYRAVLTAADRLDRCLPPWGSTTASFEPVRALVVGAGAAGLQAVDTARRLGALVHVHELRRRERAEAVALGATLLDLPNLPPVTGAAGLAQALDTEQDELRHGLAAALPGFDLVFASVDPPDRPPPTLLTGDAVRAMRPGSVVVDLAVGPLGGNVEGAEPDTTTPVGDGVTVMGAGNLPSQVPATASTAFAHNVTALLRHLTRGGGPPAIDPTDPLQAALLVTHRGSVLNQATWQLILDATAAAGTA
ncbi:NAD(P) transhydrogenase subunit alpha [Kitasatospora sp. NPDC088351]|uniref:NAD(P) transhydrogenase subunit alpha n=1 Tax=unclassified Kitasatospora TaxID=2633591 RepID=UPI003443E91F